MNATGADAAPDHPEPPEPVVRWWRQGPRSWGGQLLWTEVFTAVLVGLMLFAITEVREQQRQDLAERLEDQRQLAAERLENVRFVRTASAEGAAHRKFAGLDLTGAQLGGLDLAGADFTNATLTGANLTGANLAGATLSGADLSTSHLPTANLIGARYSKVTRWPGGFDAAATGALLQP